MHRAALPLLLAVLLARPAFAQDEAQLAEPHPLREMLTERLRAQQLLALQRVVDAQRALAHAASVGYVDTDGDGRGEIPTLAEALGLAPWRGSADPPAGVVGWGDALLHDDGTVEASGYLFRVVLPDATLQPAATLDDVSADAAEEHAVILAWPVRDGLSGRWTFGAHVPAGEPLATDAGYSGPDNGPRPDALTAQTADAAAAGRLDRTLTEPGTGQDAERWLRARALVGLKLRRDEPDLDGPGLDTGIPRWISRAESKLERWQDFLAAAGLEAGGDDGPLPPRAREAGPHDITAAIAEELRYPMERTGQWERQKGAFELVGATTPAKYVATENVLMVCSETFDIACHVAGIPRERMDDVGDLLIVHELVHAYDFQTHPLALTLRDCRDEAAIAAWSAIVEGHAQMVTRRVAEAYGRAEAFRDMLALSGAEEVDDSSVPAEARAALAGLSFPYHDGERFLSAVLDARGPEAVEALLRDPPERPMLIETPELWLARDPGAAPTPWTRITDALVELPPPGSEARRTPLLRRTLGEMLAAAPRLDAPSIVEGIEDAESSVAVAADGRTQVAWTVLLCRDAVAARRYVSASRVLQSAQDAVYEANPLVEPEVRYGPPAGIEGAGSGYRAHKILRSDGGDVHGQAVSVAAGRGVVEAAATTLGAPDPELERRLLRAVERTLATLDSL